MFSPDGKYLAFASNRASDPKTPWDTNLFMATWVDGPPSSASAESPAGGVAAEAPKAQ
jgi:hypothetical protein